MDIIRAWKDETYRQSLSPEDLAQLPENPAGLIELTDADLLLAIGSTVSPSQCGWTAVCQTNYCGGGGGGGGGGSVNWCAL